MLFFTAVSSTAGGSAANVSTPKHVKLIPSVLYKIPKVRKENNGFLNKMGDLTLYHHFRCGFQHYQKKTPIKKTGFNSMN